MEYQVAGVLSARDEMSAVVENAKQHVIDLENAWTALGGSMTATNATIEAARAELAALQGQATKTADVLNTVGAGGGGAGDGLKRAGAGADDAGESLSQMDRVATRLVERMALLYVLRGTFDFVAGLYEAADAILQLNSRTDVSITMLRALQSEANDTGVKFSAVAGAIEGFQKRLDDSKIATVDALSDIGVSLVDLTAHRPDDQISLIAEALDRLPTAAQRAAAEIKIFGTDAVDPLILKFATVRARIDDANYAAGDRTTIALAQAKQAWGEFGDVLGRAYDQLVDIAAKGFEVVESGALTGMLPGGGIPVGGDMANAPVAASAAAGGGGSASGSPSQNFPAPSDVAKLSDEYARLTLEETKLYAATKPLTDAQTAWMTTLRDMDSLTADNAAKMGVTTDQFRQFVAEVKNEEAAWRVSETAATAYAKAWSELNSVGVTWKDTVAEMNPQLVTTIQYYLNAGATVAQVTAAFKDQGVTIDQVSAVLKGLEQTHKDAATAARTDATATLETTKLWDQYEALKSQLSGSTTDKQQADIRRWADDLTARMQKAGADTAGFYNALGAVSNEKTELILHNIALRDSHSRASAQQAYEDSKSEYEARLVDSSNYTDADIQMSKERMEQKRQELADWRQRAEQAIAAIQGMTGAVTQSLAKDLSGKTVAEQSVMGYDLTTAAGRAAVPADIAMWLHSGYSLAQAAAIVFDLAWKIPINQNDPLFASGPGPRVPGFADGVLNFSGGLAMVGEKGPELLHLPTGSSVLPLANGGSSGLGALGGRGMSVVNHIYVNGTAADVARQVAQEIMTTLLAGRQLGSA